MSNRETKLRHKELVDGPVLDVHVYGEEGMIQKIVLETSQKSGLQWHFWSIEKDARLEQLLADWFTAYGQGKQPSLMPYHLAHLPPFTQRSLLIVQDIPFGSTLSYGEIARLANRPLAARAVGTACSRNPFPLLIPCHRVLGANQTIGGYSGAGGLQTKKELLEFEKKVMHKQGLLEK